jgi:hypothetical protein
VYTNSRINRAAIISTHVFFFIVLILKIIGSLKNKNPAAGYGLNSSRDIPNSKRALPTP